MELATEWLDVLIGSFRTLGILVEVFGISDGRMEEYIQRFSLRARDDISCKKN